MMLERLRVPRHLAVVAALGVGIIGVLADDVLAQTSPVFDAASVKRSTTGDLSGSVRFDPGGLFSVRNVTLREIIQQAYSVRTLQVVGGPNWMSSDRFDVVAKAVGEPADRPPAPPSPTMLLRIQALLADRFKLQVHKETRNLPAYALVVVPGRTGPKLRGAASACVQIDPNVPPPDGFCGVRMMSGSITARGVTIRQFVNYLQSVVGRVVIDQTRLNDVFDIDVEYAPFQIVAPAGSGAAQTQSGGSIFTAFEEQLGLRLVSVQSLVEVIVIDHIERPTEN